MEVSMISRARYHPQMSAFVVSIYRVVTS